MESAGGKHEYPCGDKQVQRDCGNGKPGLARKAHQVVSRHNGEHQPPDKDDGDDNRKQSLKTRQLYHRWKRGWDRRALVHVSTMLAQAEGAHTGRFGLRRISHHPQVRAFAPPLYVRYRIPSKARRLDGGALSLLGRSGG